MSTNRATRKTWPRIPKGIGLGFFVFFGLIFVPSSLAILFLLSVRSWRYPLSWSQGIAIAGSASVLGSILMILTYRRIGVRIRSLDFEPFAKQQIAYIEFEEAVALETLRELLGGLNEYVVLPSESSNTLWATRTTFSDQLRYPTDLNPIPQRIGIEALSEDHALYRVSVNPTSKWAILNYHISFLVLEDILSSFRSAGLPIAKVEINPR